MQSGHLVPAHKMTGSPNWITTAVKKMTKLNDQIAI